MMSGIQGRDTKPEMSVRKALHRLGLRYRLHRAGLPGKPDLVFPKYGAIVFVNGCFWHQHSCPAFKMPSTRVDFWRQKLDRNRARDAENVSRLLKEGWRVAIVWECSLKNAMKECRLEFFDQLADWIKSSDSTMIEF